MQKKKTFAVSLPNYLLLFLTHLSTQLKYLTNLSDKSIHVPSHVPNV